MGAQGIATLDFGAFPGDTEATVVITGQAGILAGSLIEAWIRPETTADHSADEARVEDLDIVAGNIVAGTGFTIYGLHQHVVEGFGTDIYGAFSVGWVWN
jgi:hypothetical protein